MKRLVQMFSVCLLLFCLASPVAAADAPKARPAGAPFLEHVHIYCQQLAPMVEFFEKAFDAQVTVRRKFGADDGAILDVGGGGVTLFIQQTKVTPGKADVVAYDHIGFTVVDIEASLKKVLAVPGVKLDREIQPSGTAKTAFVRGPEGIRAELIQRPKP